jgi:CRP/FNR family transcriptional regulator, anaerobic regulatory protein
MEGYITNRKPHTNQCSQCRISHLCLPAMLNKQLLQQSDEFIFNSRVLNPGEHLCHQGEKHSHLYLLRSGLLKSYINQENGDEFVMYFHLPPELFGWEGIDEEQLSFSIVALDYSNVCEIPLKQIESLIAKHPELQTQIFKLVNQTIRNNNIAMLKTTAEQKVSTFILLLSKHYKSLGYPHYHCQLSMTHQDIANYLRIAPETISRTLHQLQNRGLIKVYRKKIHINNIAELKRVSYGIRPNTFSKKKVAK